jgi:regulatory protein
MSARASRAAGRSERPTHPRGTARDRALALLGVRWRSESELHRRLLAVGFPEDEVAEALEGLERAGLIDDSRFALEVVRDQAGRRHASSRAIRAALRQKGVDAAVADEALSTAGDDGERARALAESKASRMASLAPEAAYRRLYGLLLRRGYAFPIARDACRAALAPLFGPESSGDTNEP